MALITDFIQSDKITNLATALIRRKTVFGSITAVTNNFQGSEAQVPVLSGADTVGDYVEGTDMTVTNVGSTKITIPIDQKKYMNNYVDEVDDATSAQSALPQLLNTMTNTMANLVDKFVLQQIYEKAFVTSAETGVTGTPITIDDTNISSYLGAIAKLLTKADAPEDGRFVVITPDMEEELTENNIYIAATTDEMARRRGYRGMYKGLEVYVSNNLLTGAYTGTDRNLAADEVAIVAGIKGAADTIFNFDKFREKSAEDRFGNKYQALSVYGSGANTPKWLVTGVVLEA